MFKLIKKTSLDISLLYRNFIHFTLSKIFIFLSVFLISIVSILPILLIIWLVLHFVGAIDYTNFTINIFAVIGNIYAIIAISVLFILGFIILMLTYTYNFILFSRLSFSYIDGKKLPYKKNSYFDFSLFFVYSKVFLLVSLIILVPIFIFLISFVVLFFAFGGTETITAAVNSGNYSFSIISFIILVISLLVSAYLSYKTMFSFTVLVDEYDNEEESRKAIHYIKKSFKLTRGAKKLLKFSIVSLLVLIVTLPIYIPQSIYSSKVVDLNNYLSYKTGNIELTQDNIYIFQRLEVVFSKTDIKVLEKDLSYYENIKKIFYFLEFLFITGLMAMTMSSLYIRLFKKD